MSPRGEKWHKHMKDELLPTLYCSLTGERCMLTLEHLCKVNVKGTIYKGDFKSLDVTDEWPHLPHLKFLSFIFFQNREKCFDESFIFTHANISCWPFTIQVNQRHLLLIYSF